MSKHPICTVCPGCGCPRFTRTRPDQFIAFAQDRSCTACGTRYTPPTPVWGAYIFIAIGALLALGCFFSLLLGVVSGNYLGLLTNGAVAIVGVLCVAYGIRSLQQVVVQPPDWQEPIPIDSSMEKRQDRGSQSKKITVGLLVLVGVAAIAVLFQPMLRQYQKAQEDARKQQENEYREKNKDQLLAIQAIEKLGGSVSYWGQRPPNPDIIHFCKTEYQFTDDDLKLTASFPAVTCFNIASTRVTDTGLKEVGRHTKLQRLHLECPQVTDAGLMHLRGLTKLDELILKGTKTTDRGLQYLAEQPSLPALKRLDLSNTSVSDAGLAHLHRFEGLEELMLDETSVTDAGLCHLNKLHLRGLTLIEVTAITDKGLRELETLETLQELALGGTKVTADGIKEFIKKRPDCRVYKLH